MGVASIEAKGQLLPRFSDGGVLDPCTRRVRCAFDLMAETGARLTMSQGVLLTRIKCFRSGTVRAPAYCCSILRASVCVHCGSNLAEIIVN